MIVSWEQVQRNALDLAAKLPDDLHPDVIVAITRGGLVPAAIIACALDIRFIDTICITSYKGHEQGDIHTLKRPTLTTLLNSNVLVIDDLVDSGVTVKTVRALLPRAHYAVLYAKPNGRDQVDTYVHGVPQNVWIEFPWER